MTERRFSPNLWAERSARHPLAIGVVALIFMAALAYASWVIAEGVPFLEKYSVNAVVPTTGPIVRKGDEVRIAGQLAGKVTKVSYVTDGRKVYMRLYKNRPIHADASATVEVRGLAGAVYIELVRGSHGPALASGSTIALAHAATGEDLASVAAGFDASARTALGRTLDTYGQGLIGTGDSLNQAIADLPAVTTQGNRLLRAIAPGPTQLADTFGGLDRLARGFQGDQPLQLAGFVNAGRATLDAFASRTGAVGTTLDELPATESQVVGTLPIADPVLRDAAAASTDLSPGIAALRRALPDVNGLLARRANLAQLSRLTNAADPVLRGGLPLLGALDPLSRSLQPFIGPLVPIAHYFAPYRDDIVGGLANLADTGLGKYQIGQAPGTAAIRFTPIFTCMTGRDPYPAPNQAVGDRGKQCVP
jgi:ABC-type transporter Mla subunit MlaD